MAKSKGTRRNDSRVIVGWNRYAPVQISLDDVSINSLAHCLPQHFGADVRGIDRSHIQIGQNFTAQAGAGPCIQNRTLPAYADKGLSGADVKLIIFLLCKPLVIIFGPFGIETLVILGRFQRVCGMHVRCFVTHGKMNDASGYSNQGCSSWVRRLRAWTPAALVALDGPLPSVVHRTGVSRPRESSRSATSRGGHRGLCRLPWHSKWLYLCFLRLSCGF